MAVRRTLLTADELARLPDDRKRYELVRGELRTMPPAGAEHGMIAARLCARLLAHVEPRRLGDVFAAETGFLIERDPDTVRAPDAAFVAAGRFPEGHLPAGFAPLAPDLIAEVVSPFDAAAQVEEKVHEWLRAGVRLVWVIHPATRSVTVYRSLAEVRVLTEVDPLDGTPVLPGFTCPVRDLFPQRSVAS
ncbi:MAG: Uma2 family endonuclease [Chloroflexi bacterium]|nr:Uma2 family endonuclease [Chloroflexota bacterium]